MKGIPAVPGGPLTSKPTWGNTWRCSPTRLFFRSRRRGYNQQNRKFGICRICFGNLLADEREDGPALVLLQRAVNALVEGPGEGHPIWDLPGQCVRGKGRTAGSRRKGE